jgi:hypothetical protein
MLTTTYNVPSNKINIGTAFYGRSQTGATTLHQTTNCGEDAVTFSLDLGTPQYYNVVDKLNLFDYHWDNVAKVPYLTGKSSGSAAGTFVSYDNKQSIGMKAEYIVNNNARGTIIWEITGDYLETAPGSGVVASTPLIDTMNYVFCHTTVTGVNQLSNDKQEDFTIYPNPNKGQFNIQYNGLKNSTIYIYDTKGVMVYSQPIIAGENKINTSHLTQGLYIIKQVTESVTNYKKVVID